VRFGFQADFEQVRRAVGLGSGEFGSLLFDTEKDPKQERPLTGAETEERMTATLAELLKQADAPAEQSQRLGLA
jgi:hypothetical protein